MRILVNDKSRKLLDAGLDAGFYNQAHFIRIFKNFCGETPKKFRKKAIK
ncbi:helix-turn-helix domain-containing protein [Fulvitalea axinellae]